MSSRYKFILFVVLGALCLMLDAFYNGYPIVYADTSTYLASGFQLETPVDRPITYGLFIRLTSLNGLSLWVAVFFQSLILSYLIFLFLKQFAGNKPFLFPGLMIIFLLSMFTGISWTSCQLIADVFTPIALLSLAVILTGTVSKGTRIFLYFLYFMAVSMHLSHILLFSLLLIVIYFIKKWLFKKELLRALKWKIAILFTLTIAAILTMGSALSKSKDVFMMGAMVEQGITQKYLDEYCGSRNFKLCPYKDSLPKTLNAFVWDSNSPFNKTGGWSEENRKEYHDIIFSTFTKPKYIKLHIEASLKATVKQFVRFHIFDGNGTFLKGTEIFGRIEKYVPRDINCYSSARQYQSGFSGCAIWNKVYDGIILLSAVCLLLLLIIKKHMPGSHFRAMVFILLAGIILNDWDAATFSCVADRFGCKMMWLIPFLLAVALLNRYSQPNINKEGNRAEKANA